MLLSPKPNRKTLSIQPGGRDPLISPGALRRPPSVRARSAARASPRPLGIASSGCLSPRHLLGIYLASAWHLLGTCLASASGHHQLAAGPPLACCYLAGLAWRIPQLPALVLVRLLGAPPTGAPTQRMHLLLGAPTQRVERTSHAPWRKNEGHHSTTARKGRKCDLLLVYKALLRVPANANPRMPFTSHVPEQNNPAAGTPL
jgi:hypothetical protein